MYTVGGVGRRVLEATCARNNPSVHVILKANSGPLCLCLGFIGFIFPVWGFFLPEDPCHMKLVSSFGVSLGIKPRGLAD